MINGLGEQPKFETTETSDDFPTTEDLLNNITGLLIAANSRMEVLESHVSFLLSQNPKYMELLQKAQQDGQAAEKAE